MIRIHPIDNSPPQVINFLDYLEAGYQALNRVYFRDKLPIVTIGIHDDPDPFGQWISNEKQTRFFLTLTIHFLHPDFIYPPTRYPRFLEDVLLHEMLHVMLYVTGQDDFLDNDGHGAVWIRTCKAFAPRIGLNMDFTNIPDETFSAFPHYLTMPEFYLGTSKVRRNRGDNDTIYTHLKDTRNDM